MSGHPSANQVGHMSIRQDSQRGFSALPPPPWVQESLLSSEADEQAEEGIGDLPLLKILTLSLSWTFSIDLDFWKYCITIFVSITEFFGTSLNFAPC